MQTHLLNVTFNWSVILVCHATLFPLTAINVSLKTSGRRRVTQQFCRTTLTHLLSVVTSFTRGKLLLFISYLNSPAVYSRSDFIADWIPLRAHECRPPLTSVCYKTLNSWSFVHRFCKNTVFRSQWKWKARRRGDGLLLDFLTSGVSFQP